MKSRQSVADQELSSARGAPARPGASRTGLVGRALRGWVERPLWMLTPSSVAVLLIVIVPVAITLWLSLLQMDVSTLRQWLAAPFNGIQNYVDAFTQPSTLGVSLARSITITFAFSLLTTAAITPIGILAALSVQRRIPARGLIRALYLIPYVIPTFVTALVARLVFLDKTGLFDRALGALGITNGDTFWLLGPHAFWAMLMTEIWATWPFIYLMTLAGLQSIPKEHYEAATLDGASMLQRIRYIMLPELAGTLKLGMLLSTLFHFSNFTLAFVMFSSPPPASVEVLPINTYYNAFDFFNFGIASAIAVITIVLLVIPGYVYLRSTRLAVGEAR